MIYEKRLVGEQTVTDYKVVYYLIKKDNFFGIELQETHNTDIMCEQHYFTEDECFAEEACKLICDGAVTCITIADIVCDLVA
ncbi:MAG: hypothetical protein BEN19_08505 [Epulopiscium sp. Nuni2H_MBin003]|nr:MAG: hypothetical protein BEN19_08505 [Epulopiscium sp. Nuni2H_MBin003]